VKGVCQQLKGKLPASTRAISLIKGIDAAPPAPAGSASSAPAAAGSSSLALISDGIREHLGVDVSVLMGANIANEVAQEKFCEATIGYRVLQNGQLFQRLFDTSYFRCTAVPDVAGTELCGALKNVVAVAAGFVDGLKLGDNTKAAIIRIGLVEMKRFCQLFYAGVRDDTFFESCGVADLITTCSGGRNRKVAEARVLTGKSLEQLEAEMLNGQKLQGPLTAKDVHQVLEAKGMVKDFPLFTAVYRICFEGLAPEQLITSL
jgi:glycerol-3-phosphate dehydrogenase (NAD+)